MSRGQPVKSNFENIDFSDEKRYRYVMPRKAKVGAPDLQQMNDDELVNHLEGMPRILDAHRSVLQKRLNRMQNDLYERAMRLLMRRDMRDRSTGIAF